MPEKLPPRATPLTVGQFYANHAEHLGLRLEATPS
jgi:hypothetical protein